jgi:hypothetical protein
MGRAPRGPLRLGARRPLALALGVVVLLGSWGCSGDGDLDSPTVTPQATEEASATPAATASFTPAPTASPTPTETPAPQGATLTGRVYYNDNPISDYTDAQARFAVVDQETYSLVAFAATYDPGTGTFELEGIPPGTYVAFVTVESGIPVDLESGGDFFSRLSGLNPEFTVESPTDRISQDLDTVQVIHLTAPSDNQVPTGDVGGPGQPLPVSLAATFEWDAVPDAVRYEARLLFFDLDTGRGISGVSESVTEPRVTFSPAPVPSQEGERYGFDVTAHNAAGKTLGVFIHYYVNGSGGSFPFRAVPDDQ